MIGNDAVTSILILKKMEVFIMDPETVIEIKNAIESMQKNYPINTPSRAEPPERRPPSRQWDRVICKLCGGCGKRLGRYENAKNLAFCYECREILFPESTPARELFRGKFSHREF